MKHRMTLLIAMMLIALVAVACGGNASDSPTPAPQPTTVAATALPATAPPSAELQATEAPGNAQAVPSDCESFFGFCVTATVSGAVTGEATGGAGSSFNNKCADWAANGDPRVLELPTMIGAGESKMTVALTRIGAYTGPGTYELAAATTSGNPDSFPSIEVAGRPFSNGEGSTAVVTVAADGSGSVQAVGLVDIGSNPDPAARIDFSMQWTCQEES